MPGANRPGSAGTSTCPACRAPIYRHQVGPITVTADTTPITPGTDHHIRSPHRLTWCLPPATWSTPRLRSAHPATHRPDCPHPHHADHQCPGPQPATRTEQTLF